MLSKFFTFSLLVFIFSANASAESVMERFNEKYHSPKEDLSDVAGSSVPAATAVAVWIMAARFQDDNVKTIQEKAFSKELDKQQKLSSKRKKLIERIKVSKIKKDGKTADLKKKLKTLNMVIKRSDKTLKVRTNNLITHYKKLGKLPSMDIETTKKKEIPRSINKYSIGGKVALLVGVGYYAKVALAVSDYDLGLLPEAELVSFAVSETGRMIAKDDSNTIKGEARRSQSSGALGNP